MKKLNKTILGYMALFSIVSCSDYLDVVPDNVGTIEYAFRSRNEAEKYLFTCYSYRPEIGSVDKDPAMASDETFNRYETNGGGYVWANTIISRGFQTVTDPVLNTWDGEGSSKSAFIGIRDCNIFLENIDSVVDLEAYEKNRWIAEVKFLKAFYHYYLFKCYGPIPIIDKNLSIDSNSEEVQVYREPIDDVVTFIIDLMAEAAIDLPNAIDIVEGTEAGRVDKLAALAIRAEVLIYAASPLFNGNPDYSGMVDNKGTQLFPQNYDENKWVLAAEACKQAIDICHDQGKELYDLLDPFVLNADPIFQQQTIYREAICARWNKELIWGNTNYNDRFLSRSSQARLVRMEPNVIYRATAEYSPTLNMVERYYSSNGVPIDEDIDWQNNSWYGNRFKVRDEPAKVEEEKLIELNEQTANLHFNRESRFYASIGFDKGVYFGNGYYQFTDTDRNVKYCDFLNGQVSGYQGGAGYSITGYSIKKMHSFKNPHTSQVAGEEFYPFPIMRLADLYLLYAEALNEVNGPNNESFIYLDAIRARVGLDGVKASWSAHSTRPNKPDTKEGLREIIHRERAIELAFEGKRFWDIRRWKQIQIMNNQPRGWNIQGKTNEEFYKVVTLPQTPLSFSLKDYFWPIKESNLFVNQNLIQNYGW
ncbi:RagB/SusD family nutrient uptake outer membrane protein [Flavivirga aquimarina]|uniref:RagB/SusD family nutrient uptake outer membrane protein n=1 Tax=Flavivirga aquimarina TaxID=2027862 RepID=A0ABT8W9N3_9FLAO|nr:RagB/SusD family nutrient uptake outer membrane protein [Flavivirga aquimarina]MDO5969853.1 RagB/SusD family nutrient uptake outer membrane protein [Flavivirga aquimarina]